MTGYKMKSAILSPRVAKGALSKVLVCGQVEDLNVEEIAAFQDGRVAANKKQD